MEGRISKPDKTVLRSAKTNQNLKQEKFKRARLDVWLRVGEEGPPLDRFNLDPFIDLWFLAKFMVAVICLENNN